jgi:hypothetical protein
MEPVARAHRPRPAELVEARADDAPGQRRALGREQAHRQRRRVPAAGGKAAEDRVFGRFVVEVKGLRVERRGEAADRLGVHRDLAGPVGLARREVLKIELVARGPRRVRHSTRSRRHPVDFKS